MKDRRSGLCRGDRAVYLGVERGWRGKHCTVVWVGSRGGTGFAGVRFDCDTALLVATAGLHGIPNRPRPDF